MNDTFIDLHVPALLQFDDCSYAMQPMGSGICDIHATGPSQELRRIAALFARPVEALWNGETVWLDTQIFLDGVPVREVVLRVGARPRQPPATDDRP